MTAQKKGYKMSNFENAEPCVEGRDESPYSKLLREQQRQIREAEISARLMMTHIVQQIIGENPNENVYLRAMEIEEENGLPPGITADDVYDHFYKIYRGRDEL